METYQDGANAVLSQLDGYQNFAKIRRCGSYAGSEN